MPHKQKFRRGDLVHVDKHLGGGMHHFRADADGIVLGSYADQYGGDDVDSYTILFCDDGDEVSWYDAWQLEFIRHVGSRGIKQVKQAKARQDAVESDLDWIIHHWTLIRDKMSGASMGTLFDLVGLKDPWGPHGEGYTYFSNARAVVHLLDGVLMRGKRSEIELFCKTFREQFQKCPTP